LQGVLVLVEQRMQLGVLARVWTLGWLVVPLPLLFHPWFIKGIVWPIASLGPVSG
jgi:alginate O-acetyltransferase complex protein AlgI